MTNINLIQGDCLDVLQQLENDSIDCIVTDPPYKTTARGNAGNSGGMLQEKINMKGQVFDFNNIKIENWLPELYRVLKPSGHAYIMTNHKNITHFLQVVNNSDFHFIKNLIWVKDNKIMGQYYMNQFEYILFLRKGKAKKINNCGTSDVLYFPNKKEKNSNGKPFHPTQKPTELMSLLIENSTNEGDIVLDPFIGGGSTGLACVTTNRKFIGVELDKNYFNIAEERINHCKNEYDVL